jgi:hypothetical protein
MKYKIILFLSILSVFAACSTQTEHAAGATTMHVAYSSYSSLDGSKTERSGTLTYAYDTALYYNLVSSDSTLYYKHENSHGLLDLKTKTIFKNNELDEAGRPMGVFEAELIPLFLADTAYISDLEKDTAITCYKKKIIGDVVFLERYSDEISYNADSSGQSESEHIYVCYHRLNHKIYFQLTILKLNISGISFTQKDWLHFSYPDIQPKTLNDYDDLISKAKEPTVSAPPVKQVNFLKVIPDFTYSDLNDRSYQSKDIQQHYALLEFWYLSCAPCLKNMQHLNTLYLKYKNQTIKFLVLNDADKDVEKIKKIRINYDLQYDVYYRGESLKKELAIEAHPHTIIYDTHTSKTIYEAKGTGSAYLQEIEHVLDSLIHSKSR